MDVKLKIIEKAKILGFDEVGFSMPEENSAEILALAKFTGQGRHGDMGWLARQDGKRGVPNSLMFGVKTIISLGINYGPSSNPLDNLDHRDCGSISVYARGDDYHEVIKKPLKELALWICKEFNVSAKQFIDTAPIMEKPIAMRAGLGWQGKHTNLVSRNFGSWLFLGEIFTDLIIAPDMPESDHCGECDACLRACPTGALDAPYQIDARKCISYLTIEHKGSIEPELMANMGNRIYGCDDCLTVCPWTKFTKSTNISAFESRDELQRPSLAVLANLNEGSFRELFAKSPIKRTGRDRFIRNVMIAIGNSKKISLYKIAKRFVDDQSSIVAEAARRACKLLEKSNNVAKKNE